LGPGTSVATAKRSVESVSSGWTLVARNRTMMDPGNVWPTRALRGGWTTMSMAYRMSSGDGDGRSDLERPGVRVWCLDRTDLPPSARGLATSAIDDVAVAVGWFVSPLSNSAMRVDRLNDAWLRLRCEVVLRDLDLIRDWDGTLIPFPLVDALRAGFGFLPRPCWEPLRI
jgi:hypothetical protein